MIARNVTVVSHPLVQHKLSLMRDQETPTAAFRQLLREIALLLGYEVTRHLPIAMRRIRTPLTAMDAPFIEGKKLVVVPILRAGLGLADGLLDLMLATAHSAIAAVHLLKRKGCPRLQFLALLAAPEGVAAFTEAHPDVPLTVAAIDERLNDHAYIVPGLGDAGDRLFGTK